MKFFLKFDSEKPKSCVSRFENKTSEDYTKHSKNGSGYLDFIKILKVILFCILFHSLVLFLFYYH